MQEEIDRRHGSYDPLSAPGRVMEPAQSSPLHQIEPLSGAIRPDTAPSELEIPDCDCAYCETTVQSGPPSTEREQTGGLNRDQQIVSDPLRLTPAQILFLWDEHVKRGRIQVWIDDHGVFHFKAEAHPGCTLEVA